MINLFAKRANPEDNKVVDVDFVPVDAAPQIFEAIPEHKKTISGFFGIEKIRAHSEKKKAERIVSKQAKSLEKENKKNEKIQAKNQKRWNNHGIPEEVATSNTVNVYDGFISKFVSQNIADDAAMNTIKAYCSQLASHKFKNEFFSEKDGQIYNLVKNFYEAEFGTPNAECDIMDLTAYLATRRRQILGKEFSDEKGLAKDVRKSYRSAKRVGGIDALKTMAWAVTHSYTTGLFFDTKGIFDMIPKGTDLETIFPIWNMYINSQSDIVDGVKNLFIINDGKCEFVEQHREKFCFPAVDDHPTEDPVFQETDEPRIFLDVNEENKKLDEQFKAAVENDTSEKKAFTPPKEPVEAVKFNVEPPKAPVPEVTFGKTINMADVIGKMQKQNIGENNNPVAVAAEVKDDGLPKTNEEWENLIPRLDKLSNVVMKAGYDVKYKPSNNYYGLFKALVIDKKTRNVVNTLIVDPCILYGDTLRICQAGSKDMDIRKECFVPISQENILIKLIKNKLSKSERKQIMSKLPKEILDDSTMYMFFDRVDMRGLHSGERTGIPFDDWKLLVKNISYIITKENKLSNLRFRILEYKDPTHFSMICDFNSLCAYKSKILHDPLEVEGANHETMVEVNGIEDNKLNYRTSMKLTAATQQ